MIQLGSIGIIFYFIKISTFFKNCEFNNVGDHFNPNL